MGVSITPVREAIFRLISEQGLEMQAATAVYVPYVNSEKLREIQQIRFHLEGMGAAEAAQNITRKQLDNVLSYVAVGKEEATHLCGGDVLTGPGFERGYYVTPALFTDVTQQMRIAREEIFGPVIALIEVDG
ncbi:hypothetical protein G6F32_016031 [Rhizopus arrhizus]|nr:hypothetical protein G6F32_016031 [Rhizopus arrhizus]